MEKMQLTTGQAKEFVDITSKLCKIVSDQNWNDGVLTVFVPHTSAAITINENADPDVPRDLLQHLQKLIPRDADFRHSEENSDAHLMASLFGSSVQVIVQNGELQLGRWQSVFFCEFDGPREREVWISFIES